VRGAECWVPGAVLSAWCLVRCYVPGARCDAKSDRPRTRSMAELKFGPTYDPAFPSGRFQTEAPRLDPRKRARSTVSTPSHLRSAAEL